MNRYVAAKMPEGIRNRLNLTCTARHPYESCGVLFGSSRDGHVEVDGFVLIRNVSKHPESSFAFDPGEWLQVAMNAQKNQRSIVGYFHSHPFGSPFPSQADGEGWDGCGTYWIVGGREGSPEIRAYGRNDEGRWYPIPLSFLPI